MGDETVQCCHDQLTYVSPTTYNNPGVYPTGGEYEGTKGVVVPTEEGSGTPSSPISDSGDSRAGVVVPSFSTPNTVEGEGKNKSRVPASAKTERADKNQGGYPPTRPQKGVRARLMACNLTVPTWYQPYHKHLRPRGTRYRGGSSPKDRLSSIVDSIRPQISLE